jgi:hypothetical protein
MKEGKKSWVVVGFVILMISSSATALGHSDPLITDEIGDVSGSLSFLFPQKTWAFLDIESAWLYETSTEPDNLYASIKVSDLTLRRWHTIYTFCWEYNGVFCAANVHLGLKGAASDFFAEYGDHTEKITDGILDTENDIITIIVPKSLVGDPKPGDVLTQPYILTGMRPFQKDHLILLLLLTEIGKDYAGIGKDYIVQY